MNPWISRSIEYANRESYLDDLFAVYPTIPEGSRDIDVSVWNEVVKAYKAKNHRELVKSLLKLDLFPVKDSYVAHMRRDVSSLDKNPETLRRLCNRLYEMGLEKLREKASEPKETNRQIGPFFRAWLRKGELGAPLLNQVELKKTRGDAILDAGDAELKEFARRELNYNRDKGLDFIARFGGKYVIGEAKFLTDFGGHQNAQLSDALSTLATPGVKAIKIAVLDGVVYIKGKNKMFKQITEDYSKENIMSALVLKDFLRSI